MTINPDDPQDFRLRPPLPPPPPPLPQPNIEELARQFMASKAAKNRTAAAQILMREGWSFEEVAEVLGYRPDEKEGDGSDRL